MKSNGTEPLINRGTVLSEVALLVRKGEFSREDSARCSALLDLADRLAPGSANPQNTELRDFEKALRNGQSDGRWGTRETRDMGVATGSGGAFLVPQGFVADLQSALAMTDRLFSPSVANVFQSDNGNTFPIPAADDTQVSGEIVSEGMQDTLADPTVLGSSLPPCPTYRSQMVKASVELLQDSNFDLVSFLAKSFAVRLARRIGPDLVAALVGAAEVGVTAAGSSGNDGSSSTGANSVGSDDLFNLMASVDPAYLVGQRVKWFMSWPTIIQLWRLKDREGRPVFRPEFNEAGEPVLLGWGAAVCPSFQAIQANAKPIAFGNGDYFAVRIVKNATTIARFVERFGEYGIVAFRGLMRCNSILVCAAAASTPIKVLQCAAS